jgi:ribosome-binding protein aMBF1 (putative translation factor)
MGLRIFVPIQKIDVENRLVSGIAAEEAPDKTGEIMDYASSKPHFEAWSGGIEKASGGKSKGNVRAMHGKVAAGKLTAMEFDDPNLQIPVVAKIVDDQEWDKTLEGVYTGFSIGGEKGRVWKDPENPALQRYTAIPNEISIVDNPAMYGTTFEVHKAGEAPMQKVFVGSRPFRVADELLEKLRGDGTLKKEDRAEFVKMVETALEAANQAQVWARQLVAELALLEGEPETWTLQDALAAVERLVYVKDSLKGKAAHEAAEAQEAAAAAPVAAGTAPGLESGEGGMTMSADPTRLKKMVGEHVKAFREEAGLSEMELAGKIAGATEDTIKAVESGEAQPTLEVLAQIAKACKKKLDDYMEQAEGEGEQEMEAQAPGEEPEAEPEAEKAIAPEGLIKLAKSVEAQAEAVADLKKGFGEKLEKQVAEATAGLEKTIAEMNERLQKIADSPAPPPGRPVDKTLGHDAGAAEAAVDLQKMADNIDALEQAGRLTREESRQMRRSLSMAAVPRAS